MALYFLDGTNLEKTDTSYLRHAPLRKINGSDFIPKAKGVLPLSLMIEQSADGQGINAVVTEESPDFGVNYVTEITGLRIPKW